MTTSSALLNFTDAAARKVYSLIEEEHNPHLHLRVFITGGGCSGFQYGFTFDEKRDDDNVISCGDISVLVDVPSLVYMKGAVVDYVADFRGAGFVVKNPQSKGECGCGTSFTV